MSRIEELMDLEGAVNPQILEALAAEEPLDDRWLQHIQQKTLKKIGAASEQDMVQVSTVSHKKSIVSKKRRGGGWRLVLAMAACALVISLGTAAAARLSTDGRLLQLFHADSQSQIAQLNEMSSQIGQSCETDGYIVTLQQAISDRHHTWVLMEVEGPAEVVLDENLVYFQSTHIQMEKLSGHGYTIYPLPDAVPGDNKLSYILDFSARNQLAGQKLRLQLGQLTENIVDEAQSLIGCKLLAEGPWEFEIEVPKQDSTVSMWQWRVISYKEDNEDRKEDRKEDKFLLCRMEVSPLSISLEAMKLQASVYTALRQAPLQVYLSDGTCLELTCGSSGSGGVWMQYQYEFSTPVQIEDIERICYCGQELNW